MQRSFKILPAKVGACMVSKAQKERLKLKKNSRIAIINRGEAALRFITALREYNIQNSSQLEAIAFTYLLKTELFS